MPALLANVSRVILIAALSLSGTSPITISPKNAWNTTTKSVAYIYPRLMIENQTEIEDRISWPHPSSDGSISYSQDQTPEYSGGYSALTTYSNSWLKPVVNNEVQYNIPYMANSRPVQRRSPADEIVSNEIFENNFEQDFMPISSGVVNDPSHYSFFPSHQFSRYPFTKSVKNVAAAAVGSVFAPITQFSVSDPEIAHVVSSSPGLGGGNQWQELTSHHTVPITITELKKDAKWDMKKLGILALIKIGLAKLKALGMLKLLLFIFLKFKLALIMLFVKFVLFFKAMNLVKSLLLPLLLLIFLPLFLLMLPLMLLPLLLPLLLLLLPVQVPQLVAKDPSRMKVLDYVKTHKSDIVMDIMSKLLDSEKCIERIACQLATKKESKMLYPIMKWYVNRLGNTIRNERISTYVQAFMRTVKEYDGNFEESDGYDWCLRKFRCDRGDELADPTAAAAAYAVGAASDDEKLVETETVSL